MCVREGGTNDVYTDPTDLCLREISQSSDKLANISTKIAKNLTA